MFGIQRPMDNIVGYNATPVWNSPAKWINVRVSTNSVWAMLLLLCIDLALLALMFLALWRTSGLRVMLFAFIFCDANYFVSFDHIKGAFMPLDWVTLLMITVCLIHAKWQKTAGMLRCVCLDVTEPRKWARAIPARWTCTMIGTLSNRVAPVHCT